MTHSLYNQTGITVSIFQSLVDGFKWTEDLKNEITSYDHTLSMLGGYLTMNLGLNVNKDKIENYFMNYIGKRVESYDAIGETIWDGFINKISANIGGYSFSIGPLLDVNNKVRLEYTTIRYNTNPPIGGIKKKTPYATNTTSIAKYGTIAKIVNGGQMTTPHAVQVRDSYLEERAFPEISQQVQLNPQSGDMSIKFECLGYVNWLDLYEYEKSGTGSWRIDERIIDVLGQETNSFLDSNYSYITENSLTVPVKEKSGSTGLNIIKDCVARGDSTFNRYVFGVYKDRIVKYYPIDDGIPKYYYNISNKYWQLYDKAGTQVPPWKVMPGEWLYTNDFLAGLTMMPLKTDPRAMLIEGVQYTSPFQLSINGGKLRTLPQLLARYGLSGI